VLTQKSRKYTEINTGGKKAHTEITEIHRNKYWGDDSLIALRLRWIVFIRAIRVIRSFGLSLSVISVWKNISFCVGD
jgi:hypothetical protein